MKKLNKNQKQHLKQNLLKALHVLGYVCIAFTVLTVIILIVNGCKPKSQNRVCDDIQLNDLTPRNLNYESEVWYNNIDTNNGNTVRTDNNSVYLFTGHRSLETYNYAVRNSTRGYDTYSNCSLYYVNLTSNTVENIWVESIDVHRYDIELYENLNGSTRSITIRYDTTDKILLVFEQTKYWWYSNQGFTNYHCVYELFNDILVYVGDTFATQDYGNEYLNLSYDTYRNLYTNNFIPGGKKYLYPFVIGFGEPVNFFPISFHSFNHQWNLKYFNRLYFEYYPSYTDYVGKYYSYAMDEDIYPVVVHETIALGFGQALGFHDYHEQDYYFTTYCGSYIGSPFYQYYLSYAFDMESDYTFYQVSNLLKVSPNLNVTLNEFNYFNEYQNNDYVFCFDDAILIYDGRVWDEYQIIYKLNAWYGNVYNSHGEIIGSAVYENSRDPMFRALINECRYGQLYLNLKLAYNNKEFTRLNAYSKPLYPGQYDNSNAGQGNDIDSSGLGGIFTLISTTFNSIADIFNISLFGYITIGSVVFFPLVIIIILFVVKMFKR